MESGLTPHFDMNRPNQHTVSAGFEDILLGTQLYQQSGAMYIVVISSFLSCLDLLLDIF